jgi:hypothetical protein
VSREKPLIRCHLSLKLKGVYEKSDSHRDEENRRSQSEIWINGCVDCVHLRFATATNSHCFASVPGLACFATIVKQDMVSAFINPAKSQNGAALKASNLLVRAVASWQIKTLL